MYSRSYTPERCVRDAFDEHTAGSPDSAMQNGPASSSSMRRSVSAASGFTSDNQNPQ